MIKAKVKKYTPAMTKIRGTITSTTKNIEINPTLSADDFNYPVPRGVRLIRMPGAATNPAASSTEASRRNACINNLRQIDAAKNEFALEKGKKNGDPVTATDIAPYITGRESSPNVRPAAHIPSAKSAKLRPAPFPATRCRKKSLALAMQKAVC